MTKKRLPLEIFRAGRHVAMSGEVIQFTEADLAQIASVYNPKVHEAPVVLGHPRDNAPAYGWAQTLKAQGSSLFAAVDQLEPAFAEAVRDGRYKKVSASFYKKDSPANPTPGKYYLRHIGFLGAQPPAVKGLLPVEFAGSDTDCLTLEFADLDAASLFRSLREWIIGKYGLEEADKALPPWTVDWVQTDAAVEHAKDTANLAEAAAEEVAEATTDPTVDAVTAAMSTELRSAVAESVRAALAEPLAADLTTRLTAALGESADAAAVQAAAAEAVKAALGESGEGGENPVNAAVEGAITEALSSAAMKDAIAGAIKAALQPALETAIETAAPSSAETVDNSEPRQKTKAERELEQREARLRARERELMRAEHTSFVEGVLREGRRFPVSKELTIDLLEHLGSSEVSFGEGDGAKTPLELVKALLAKAPKEVEFRELGGSELDLAFGEDADPAVVARAAAAYQAEQRAAGHHISTSEAVNHVKGRNQ